MVYRELYLIRGLVLTKQQIGRQKYLRDLELFFEDDLINQNPTSFVTNSDELNPQVLNLYAFPGCSENTEQFILGEVVSTYYHRKVSCDKCERWEDGKIMSLCDECIGTTDNGTYDTDAILEGPVECPCEHVCYFCGHDNREVVDKCKRCWFDMEECGGGHLSGDLLSRQLRERECKFYYMLDDCTCCT